MKKQLLAIFLSLALLVVVNIKTGPSFSAEPLADEMCFSRRVRSDHKNQLRHMASPFLSAGWTSGGAAAVSGLNSVLRVSIQMVFQYSSVS